MDSKELGSILGVTLAAAVVVTFITDWSFLVVWLVILVGALLYVLPKAMERARREGAHAAAPKRAVEFPNGVTVVFTKVDDRVTWEFVGLVGEPHFMLHRRAQEVLTEGQLGDGEDPWFPDVAERVRARKAKESHDDQ